MTIEEFIALMEDKVSPATAAQIEAFEAELGSPLPDDYRRFLPRVNGGFIPGWYGFHAPTSGGDPWPFVHHVLGFREELHLSLRFNRGC
jgi:hypothetical protein